MPESDDQPPAIPESDDALLAECRIETFTSGGKGGQHQNRTESGVRLVHIPTGIRSVSRSERSQHQNRKLALARLRKKLEATRYEAPPRTPTRVPRRERKKRLESKRRRSRTKKLRRPPDSDD